MTSRRRFLQLTLASPLLPLASRLVEHTDAEEAHQTWVPLVMGEVRPPAEPLDDMPIIGSASGTAEQAVLWIAARCAAEYTSYDVNAIVEAYRDLGESVGLDWFLALAQMAHETGTLTSWWSARPRRNPAGIGVTGVLQGGTPDKPPGPGWSWDETQELWRAGWSFPSWAEHSIPAHLGRLLAYALTDEQANEAQRDMIDYALAIRPLPASYRGVAPTIVGLNGRWAVPGTTYGQSIVDLVRRMRGS